jgi:hypothetical protein
MREKIDPRRTVVQKRGSGAKAESKVEDTERGQLDPSDPAGGAEQGLTVVLPADFGAGGDQAPHPEEGVGEGQLPELDGEGPLEVTEVCEDFKSPGAGSVPALVIGGGEEAPATALWGSKSAASEHQEPTEEVFVILPEQLEGEVPVVETQAVPDAELTEAMEGEPIPVEEIALRSSHPDAAETDETFGAGAEQPTEEADAPTEIAGDEELDSLASELDDEVLRAGDENAGDSEDGLWFADGEMDAIDDAGASAARRLPRFAVPLAAAAVLVITAYLVLQPLLKSSRAMVEIPGGGVLVAVEQTAPGHDGRPAGEFPAGTKGLESLHPPEEGTAARLELRQELREKLLLALRLGTAGEMAHD